MEAVLFDLDGTLIDSAEPTAAALMDAVASTGKTLTRRQLAAHTGGPLRDWLATQLQIPSAGVEALYRDYVERIKARAGQMVALDGAGSLLCRLHAAAVPLAIVTTRLLEIAIPIVEAQGWSGYFQLIVGQETAPRPKPAPDPALYALEAPGDRHWDHHRPRWNPPGHRPPGRRSHNRLF
jgi:phosphoglycolate phosphatase-like HAD superfamily hydrolase